MSWTMLVVVLSTVAAGHAINRPVYKIALTQKGFAQFLQYDLETPPLREFTLCTWLKVFELNREQTFFSYVVNSNNRIIRIWLHSGGRQIGVMINERVASSVPIIDLTKDVWRHVCLSYQSDYGAWALYVDSRLATCEASHSLYGFVIPGGGSMILGYGTAEDGSPTGLNGEIFGASMILSSTIERNFTLRSHPNFIQKSFIRNKLSDATSNDYIILKNLNNYFEVKTKTKKLSSYPLKESKIISHTTIGPLVIGPMESRNTKAVDYSNNSIKKDILNFTSSEFELSDKTFLCHLINLCKNGKLHTTGNYRAEKLGSGTHEMPSISEYETPRPSRQKQQGYYDQDLEFDKPPASKSVSQSTDDTSQPDTKVVIEPTNKIPEYEIPLPAQQKNNVYGQWISSRYAGNVLNYLKNIKFYVKESKIPATITLTKLSDNYPYASEIKANIVKPQLNNQIKGRKVKKRFPPNYFYSSSAKVLHRKKRNITYPKINIQIVDNDVRSDLLFEHAQINPKEVEIVPKGLSPQKNSKYRLHINTDTQDFRDNLLQSNKFETTSEVKAIGSNSDIVLSNSLLSVLPFIKSVEYFIGNNDDTDLESDANNIYLENLSGNKWQNVIEYNNKYNSPRQISTDEKSQIDEEIKAAVKKQPIIPLKYRVETDKLVLNDDPSIIIGKALAMQVSNHAYNDKDSISLLKYNHGYLPGHNQKSKLNNQTNFRPPRRYCTRNGNNFHKHVKIGNLLNEKDVERVSEEHKKRSFKGRYEEVPDILRYRLDNNSKMSDKELNNVSSSPRPNICNNIELYDHIFYVQPDGSIDMTHILSPVKIKNLGIKFIIQNYKSCSLDDSSIEKSHLLLINWSLTPVKLFGGARAMKTKDLCGFF